MKHCAGGAFSLILFFGLMMGCTSKDQIKKALVEDPTILAEAIEKNPSVILEALNKAVRLAQENDGKKREDEEKKQLEEAYKNPLQPQLRADETYRGSQDGVLTLVEYSDFQCPYCARGFETVMTLMEKYKGKLRFVYKHLPLEFHPQAMLASQYYEAARLQGAEKAFQFHDRLYKDQSKLKNGEAFFKEVAKSIGLDLKKLETDVKSEAVKTRIEQDIKEAQSFGIQGTPGFVFNGVPVKGAYPTEHFEGIVEELKKRNKITL